MRRHRLPLCLAVWAAGLACLATSASARGACEDVAAVACIQWLEKVLLAARLAPARIYGPGYEYPIPEELALGITTAARAHSRLDSAVSSEVKQSIRQSLSDFSQGVYSRPGSVSSLRDQALRAGSSAELDKVIEQLPAAVSRANSQVLSEQSAYASRPGAVRSTAAARVGATVATLAALVGLELLTTSKCILSGTCGGCRSVYIAVNSGDPANTYQGPFLQLNREASKASFEYGQICRTFADIIQTNKAAGAMLGSSPNTVGTGVEGALVYDILNLENKPTGCSLRIEVDSGAGLFSKAFGENDDHQPKVSFRGGTKCNPDLRYDVTQVIPGSIGQMYLYVWFQSELARLRPPPGLGF